jgi:hypothetical protein
MTKQQIRWREALTNPSASSKIKQAAMVGLVSTGVSPQIVLAWAKMAVRQFS